MSFWGKLFNKSSDKWVFIGSNDSIKDYCDSSSVKIFKESSCIEVTINRVSTTKEKQILFESRQSDYISFDETMNMHHSLDSYNLYYDKRQKDWLIKMYIPKSGDILRGGERIIGSYSFPESVDIKPVTVDVLLLNKLLKDYHKNLF
jgi:hypothetical protein